MKRNVTVSMDEDTARWVRIEAAKQDISVSQFLGEILVERRRRSEGYEAARMQFLARRARAVRGAGDPLPARGELHERGMDR